MCKCRLLMTTPHLSSHDMPNLATSQVYSQLEVQSRSLAYQLIIGNMYESNHQLIITLNRHGKQGPLDAASKQVLENEFGTHVDDEVIKQILEKGTIQESDVRASHSLLTSIT